MFPRAGRLVGFKPEFVAIEKTGASAFFTGNKKRVFYHVLVIAVWYILEFRITINIYQHSGLAGVYDFRRRYGQNPHSASGLYPLMR